MNTRKQSRAIDRWSGLAIELSDRIGRYRGVPNDDHGAAVYHDFDFWIATRGEAQISIAGEPMRFAAPGVVLMPPGVRTTFRTGPSNAIDMMFVHAGFRIDGRLVEDASRWIDARRLTLRLPGLGLISLAAPMPTAELARVALGAQTRLRDELVQMDLRIELLRVIRRLRAHARERSVAGRAGQQKPAEGFERAMAFMASHLEERLSVSRIAEVAGVSSVTLGRWFRQRLYESPNQHMTTLRMARARELLRSPDLRVKEVAEACGFRSVAFFSRVFTARHGVSPRAFRNQAEI